jgi:hypothetical protein
MIDGRHPLDALLKHFEVLGLNKDNIDELLRQDYITLVSGGAAANEPELYPSRARPPASARARMLARTRSLAAARSAQLAESEDEATPTQLMADEEAQAPQPAPLVVAMDNADRFRALYDFFNQTVKSALGLRGFVLQLKVEKAASIDDFRELRLPYLQAILKARGREMALSLRDRLDQLLGGKPENDDFELASE